MANVVLDVKNLTKQYGRFTAVDGISFQLHEGEVLGLLGPNGAGKTTTIHVLLGTTMATTGTVQYFGEDFYQHRSEILERVNYGSAYDNVPFRLTVWENLHVYARLYGVKNWVERIMLLLEQFEIVELKHKRVSSLSAGQKTRVNLCKAFINFPKVILLDEPTASLDPEIAVKVRKFILRQQRKFGVTVLFTSHNMAEVTEVCDRVLFLKKGKIVAEDTPLGLANKIKHVTLELLIEDGLKRAAVLAGENGFEYVVTERLVRFTLPEKQIAVFLSKVARQKITYSEISIQKPTLEDFFLTMTKEGL